MGADPGIYYLPGRMHRSQPASDVAALSGKVGLRVEARGGLEQQKSFPKRSEPGVRDK
jgi:hypothetical protein